MPIHKIIFGELISVQIHAAHVFTPGRIQENIPGELFMYWFRARGYSLSREKRKYRGWVLGSGLEGADTQGKQRNFLLKIARAKQKREYSTLSPDPKSHYAFPPPPPHRPFPNYWAETKG